MLRRIAFFGLPAALLALGLVLAGCSLSGDNGDDDDKTGPDTAIPPGPTSPDAVVDRLQKYLSREDFESLFPRRIGAPGWIAEMPHWCFPNWEDYPDYYSYDNLIEAAREMAHWTYTIEYRDLGGDPLLSNSRGYITHKGTGKEYPVYSGENYDAPWNQDKPAAKKVYDYGAFIGEGTDNDRRRELAGLLANMAHETGGGWPGAPGGEESWGFFFNEETSHNDPGHYCDTYTDFASKDYPPTPGASYHGRGGIQLSWNYNYGPFSIMAFNGDRQKLLDDPDIMDTDGKLGFMSGLWFWMTPQLPKPSCHEVILSGWQPNANQAGKGWKYGFGATIMVINGGFEQGGNQKPRRVNHYRDLAAKTGADISGEQITTDGMSIL